MKHKLARYDAYKDSGVEWLGEVPEHWEISKLSQAFNQIGSGTTPKSGADIYYEDGTTNWINTGDLNDGILYSCKKKVTDKALNDYSLTIYPAGSIIIAMYGATIGKVSVSMIDGCTNQACCVLNKSKVINIKFLFYWFLSTRDYIISLSYGGGQPNISQDTIKSLRLILPLIEEQKAIAAYLDTKTARIDRKIDLLTQKATQYGKLKQSLISETVTHGLDKTVAMKDSGVEWIGKVPEHWDVRHFKQFSTMKGRIGWQGLKHSEFIDEGPFLITGMNFKGGKINWNDVYHINEERYNQAPEIQLKDHDLLMTKDGTIGKLLYVENIPAPSKASLNSHLLVLRPIKKSFHPKYMYYQLDSTTFKHYTEIVKAGTTFFGISQAAVGRYIAILPPFFEQQAIADYLDTRTAYIDNIVETINTQIEKLKELRKTLINDVVTGKIKVAQ
jgi:type I restriction enzyme S subunit